MITLLGSTLGLQSTEDLEQRARARHGWHAGLVNSVIRGRVTYYERDGSVVRQANLTIYRKFPDRLRIESEWNGATAIVGFDRVAAWRAGASTVSEREARDIRSWFRLWPERLFMTRGVGLRYREAGGRVERFRAASPWGGASRIEPPLALEQVEMEDVVGPPPASGRPGDRRRVTYYVNRASWTVESMRWLEPDDPTRSVTDPGAAKNDVRVDFGDWRAVSGVLLPFEVTRWFGGRVEFRLQIQSAEFNQGLPDTIFDNPGV
jgi:hypothetical protein